MKHRPEPRCCGVREYTQSGPKTFGYFQNVRLQRVDEPVSEMQGVCRMRSDTFMIGELGAEMEDRSSGLDRAVWVLVAFVFVVSLAALVYVTEVASYALDTANAIGSAERAWVAEYEQALLHLVYYATRVDESEYNNFLDTVDHLDELGWARDELASENPDGAGIETVFREAGVPTPAASQIHLVVPWMKWLGYHEASLDQWAGADSLLTAANEYADTLRNHVPPSTASSAAVVSGVMRGIRQLDDRVKLRNGQSDAAVAADRDQIERHARLVILGLTLLLFLSGAVVSMLSIRRLRVSNKRFRESRDFLRDLMESASEAIIIMEPGGCIVHANEHACTLTGYSKSELYAIDPKDLLSPKSVEDRPVVGNELASGMIVRLEREILRKDGTVVPALVSDRRLENGYVLSIMRDITHRKQIEERLRIFRSLVDQAGDPVQVIDPETGVFLDGNEKSWTSLGYTRDEMMGMSALNVSPTLDPSMFPVSKEAFGAGETLMFKGIHRRKDGSEFPIEAHARYVALEKDYLVATVRDITLQHEIEEKLTAAKEEAETASRLKSVILRNMSHELRTPLAGIIGFAQILAEEVDGLHGEHAEMIEQSAHRLLETFNSVLDLSSIESGATRLDTEEFDLAEETRNIADSLEPLVNRKNLEMVVHTPAGHVPVPMDRQYWGRIVNNLVGNAIKFTDTGRIEIGVRREADIVQLDVSDTGIGMSSEFVPHVFEAFQQESSDLSRNYDGNGLGLAITREIVGLLGGRITVESQKGVGSTFTVRIPVDDTGDKSGETLTEKSTASPSPRRQGRLMETGS